MFKRLFNRKAQSTAEYAIVIAIVIGAAIAMQTYVKRGIQGRVAGAADKFTSKIESANWSQIFGEGVSEPTVVLKSQWEPDKLHSKSTREVLEGTKTKETMDKGGTVTREITELTEQEVGDYREYQYDKE